MTSKVSTKKKKDFVAKIVSVMSSGILFAFLGYLERQQVTLTVILDRFCAGSEIHQPEAIGICEIPLQRSQRVEKGKVSINTHFIDQES